MPRMLRRAAVMGTAVHVANKRGQATGQQEAAATQAAPATPAAPAAQAGSAAPQEDPYAELKKAKDLLDQGVLTQAEFDAQKAKILAAT